MSESKEVKLLNVDFEKPSQFTGRSVEDGLPVSVPLHDLEDLLSWKPDDAEDSGQIFSVATVPYLGKNIPTGSTKTLVCHDMAGGYLDDRFVQGKISTDDKWYYLAYWDIVDTFVYFSHHFVTIPPVGWINSAHTNGVAVLGTFIAESFNGFSKRCEAIFSLDCIWKTVADELVDIAKFYKFEGWLINIESNMNKPNTENMLKFVNYLTDKMHDAIEGSQIIWYDSVTIDGDLRWQNELNSKNGPFFEACDGIFLNYGWNEDTLNNSMKFALSSERVQDVYVGIDVFGRGCYGGGGMNSAAALKVIRKYNLSAAIFAPGWVKEVLGSKNFEENQRKFWTSLHSYCNSHSLICDNKIKYLASTFNPGMNITLKQARFLRLNEQSLMPSLSELSFQHIPLVKTHNHSIETNGSSYVNLFCNKFNVEKNHWLIVYIKEKHSEEGITPQIVISGDEQVTLEPQFTELRNGKYWALKLDLSAPCQLWCTTSREVSLEKVALIDIGKTQLPKDWLKNEAKQHIHIGITTENVEWKKSTVKDDVYLLNCTLVFENIDKYLPIWITYKTSGLNFEDLGLSRCRKFRIKDLSVPSPVYHTMDASLEIQVNQYSPIYPFNHADYPPRCGCINIKYAENISNN
ncbi:cytosolic endo-beta-N-acetylglucosaminidase-like [Styela clava]